MKANKKTKIKKFIHKFCLKKSIIFESVPDFSDNTYAVYQEMVKRGLNRKYMFVWRMHDDNDKQYCPKDKNILCVSKSSTAYKFLRIVAKAVICCNQYIPSLFDDQYSIYLGHGLPLKKTGDNMLFPDGIQNCLVTSERVLPINQEMYRMKKEELSKYVALGYPRNDVFSGRPFSLDAILHKHYNKIIVWYPTFRQGKSGRRNDGGDSVPIINIEENARALNDTLVDLDTLIVLKPHFAQDMSFVKSYNLSNIMFIDDSFYKDNKISSYEFLNNSDALLTDFSSVYFDYLLSGKPIGLIWENIDDYTAGLIDDYEAVTSGGLKIYSLLDLQNFIKAVVSGVDVLKDERNRICDLVNAYRDGKNTERVVDFIIEKAGL